MRANSHAPGTSEPAPAYSAGQVLVVSAVMLAVLLALLVGASQPSLTLGLALLAIGGRRIGTAVRRLRRPATSRRTLTYCVPGTNICIRT